MEKPIEFKRYAVFIVLLYISIVMPRRTVRRIQHHNRVLLSLYGLGHNVVSMGERGEGRVRQYCEAVSLRYLKGQVAGGRESYRHRPPSHSL
jgi:hypothetical protein